MIFQISFDPYNYPISSYDFQVVVVYQVFAVTLDVMVFQVGKANGKFSNVKDDHHLFWSFRGIPGEVGPSGPPGRDGTS